MTKPALRQAPDARTWTTWTGPASLAAVAVLGLLVRWHPGLPFDQVVHLFAVQHRSATSVELAGTVTRGGTWIVVIPIVAAAALLVLGRQGRAGWPLVTAIITSVPLGVAARLAVSIAIARPRPSSGDWLTTAGGYALPSGHTTAATLAAGTAVWAVVRTTRSSVTQAAAWSAAIVYSAAVGWSRVWLGVHWPLDVAAGLLLGAGWTACAASLAARLLPATPRPA